VLNTAARLIVGAKKHDRLLLIFSSFLRC